MGNPHTSWPPHTFVLLLSRMITSNTNSPALLSSSPFLPVCLMQTSLFFVILFFFFCYIVTSFVVTCVNKAGNKSIVLVSISEMALIKDIIVQGLGEYSNSLEKIVRN